ncbi:MAG: hypothetical protein HEQ32_01630 [Vampirovibrio sp.]
MLPHSLADIQLAKLLEVMTLLLIPVGVLLALLLYKLVFLLQNALDFVTIARFDLIPMIQDLRAITSHTAKLTEQVDSSMDFIQHSVGQVKPALSQLKSWGSTGLHAVTDWMKEQAVLWSEADPAKSKHRKESTTL